MLNQFVFRLNEIQFETDGFTRYGTKTNEFVNEKYDEQFKLSISDPEKYWAKEALDLHWQKSWILPFDYSQRRWWSHGQMNICYNCVDRWCEQGAGES